ncbi:restriction endonuclease subunit S [Leuconostoc lactis]|uniref:restriction endonuclease subunit S n=1 Tax=Leuconostoc lactis TaxID=1246 RepID=UPI000815228F|nr:restriction endonuclease subunit S [Leuconostoc lactis]ANY11859.1 restriction endonuclease subunit M [Leuconostoc lactis]
MKKVGEIFDIISGSPQIRVQETTDRAAPRYLFYGQNELESDLVAMNSDAEQKSIQTFDEVVTLKEGDVVFSLISGQAAVVRQPHQGYLLTQNFVKFDLKGQLDAKYWTYLLNEDRNIKKQLQMGVQGSIVFRYTVKQIKEITLPDIPSQEIQQAIGDVYSKQLHLQALKRRVADLETTALLEKLRRINEHE